jgi:hypothetical protein
MTFILVVFLSSFQEPGFVTRSMVFLLGVYCDAG